MARKRRGRGEGSVYQEPDGRWTGVIRFGYTAAGKRRRKKVHGATKQEVLAKMRSLPGQLAGEPCKLKVGEFLTRWLENTAKERVGETTYLRYTQVVNNQISPHIGGIFLTKLSALDVEDFYAGLKRNGVPPAARRQAAVVLTNALRHAVKLNVIPSAPTAGVTKPKLVGREMRVLSDEGAKAFLAAARRSRYYALFALAVATGMWRGELLGLHWPDVDFDGALVTVRKTLVMVKEEFVLKEPKTKSSRRTIAVPLFALDALYEHRKKMVARGLVDRAVFCNYRGGYVRGYNLLRDSFKPILVRAGLPVMRFHDLRHTHATALLSKGHPVKAVSQRLGHSDVGTTLRVYAHVLPEDDSKLAGALQAMYAWEWLPLALQRSKA
ncbi:MAG TPA: site-specific integrase, partial [Planctomycetales bacterium]|nr:site-specific integrase [Planctomycetales bacterium]